MPTDPPRQSPFRKSLLLGLGVFAAYLPALLGDFVWDDDVHVSGNVALRSLRGLGWVWTRLGTTPQYYPLTHTSFWLQYQVWGANPLAYHVGNAVLHTASALLLWRVLAKLRVPGAFGAAVLFAWHPVQVESVAWVSERKNTLSAFFYLTAMACAVRAFGLDRDAQPDPDPRTPRREPRMLPSRRPIRGSHRGVLGVARVAIQHLSRASADRLPGGLWYAATLAAALAAVLSKTVAGTLPAAILLVAWWKRGRIDWRLAAWLTPLWISAAVFGRITSHMERTVVGADGPEWQFSSVQRGLIASRAVVFYVGKLLVPTDLSFIYPRWTIDARDAAQWLYPAAVAAALLTLWLLRRRVGRGPVAAAAFFLVTVFPALGFVNVYPMRFSFVADHFQYLAGVGVFVLIAATAARLLRPVPRRWHPRAAAVAVAGLALLPLTFRHGRVFASSEILWTDVLAQDPTSVIARTQLAYLALNAGRPDDAEALFRAALAIEPEQTESLVGLSNVLAGRGDAAGALALADEAVRVRPGKIRPLLQRAALLQAADPDRAMAAYRDVLRVDERFEPARIALAKLLALSGRVDEAVEQCRRAVEIFPETLQARTLLGDLYLNQGDAGRARAAYSAALALEPANENLRRRLTLTDR